MHARNYNVSLKRLDACRKWLGSVIWLRRVEGLSQRETAERLGIQEGAVESHMGGGLRIMADAFLGASSADDITTSLAHLNPEEEHGQPND